MGNVSIDDKQSIEQMIDQVQAYQGISDEDIKERNAELYQLAVKIGMLNPVKIISSRGLNKDFIFSSNMLQPLTINDDIMDDVKVLLASIRFGEKYTDHSTINDPAKFLRYLLNNNTIGPHTANSTDYILLEKRGLLRL